MPVLPEATYRLTFVPSDDGTVDATVVFSIADPSGSSPFGWFANADRLELGPVPLPEALAAEVVQHLDRALAIVAVAHREHRAETTPGAGVEMAVASFVVQPSDGVDPPPPSSRPSGLRLRR